MMRIMNFLMLSCRKATELMEKRMLTHLRPVEKVQLFMHKQMCDGCRQYEKQSHFIDKMFKAKAATEITATSSKTLPEEVKKRIVNELEKI